MTEVNACISVLERYQNLVHLGSGWLHTALGIASSYTLKHQIGTPLVSTWLNFLYKAQVRKNPFFFSFSAGKLPSQYALAWFMTFAGVHCCPWLPKLPRLYLSVTVHSKAEKSSSHWLLHNSKNTSVHPGQELLLLLSSYPSLLQHVTFISSRHYASEFLSARPRLLLSESFSFPLGNLKK